MIYANTSILKPYSISIYIVGTEITRGIIQDCHIPLLTRELTNLGYCVRRACIVPDDVSILGDLKKASCDSDIIIVTGGLGPTSDDMTRQEIADLACVPLVKNEVAWNEVYSRLGDRVWGANERQSFIPEGFDEIPNPKGTAPGFMGSFTVTLEDEFSKEVTAIAMPGPPVEMQYMFYTYVRPFLAEKIGLKSIERDEFSIYMVPEAKLEDLCERCAIDGISWGTRFQPFKITLYVDGKSEEKKKEFEDKLSALLGKGLLERGNLEAVDKLIDYLEKNNLTVSTAESCTAGFVSKLLTDKAGSSKWFLGGVATYANSAKTALLGVDENILNDKQTGPVSSQCACQMANGIRKVLGSNIAVSVTGIAGPGGEEEAKPVGTAYIGLSSSFRETVAVRVNISPNSRDYIRRKLSVAMMLLALEYAQGGSVVDTVSSWVYI